MTDQMEKKQINETTTLIGECRKISKNSSSSLSFATDERKRKITNSRDKFSPNYLHKIKCVKEQENMNTAKNANDTINM